MADNNDKMCINCKHGCTMETAHEWIETRCQYKAWHNPFSEACEHYEEVSGDDTKK